MAPKISYLFPSDTGFFEYRRRVPPKLQEYFPRNSKGNLLTEWKKALNTKIESVAQRRWVVENEHFEATKRLAEQLLHGKSPTTQNVEQSAIPSAKQTAVKYGVHPDQAPALGVDATEEDIQNFPQKIKEWKLKVQEHKELLLDIITDEYVDEEQRAKDYQSGRWGEAGYQTPYKSENPNDPLVVQYAIVSGETKVTSHATWADATELYIKTNKRAKIRLPDVEAKWERKTRGLLRRFENAVDGHNTRLQNLDRQMVSDWLWATYPKAGTRNRNNNTLSAVVNCWNQEKKGQAIFNPFSGLSNKRREKDERKARRSFKPEELQVYLDNIISTKDEEVKLIGLLMIYTGCRTSEAAGLQIKDLRLDNNLAHVVFRTNAIRRMEKSDLERAVPLLTPVLDAFRTYKLATDSEAPVFPNHYSKNGHNNASAALRHIVREVSGIKHEDVVPYSARHTIRDRSAAARVGLARAEYIMGHVSDGSSKIHKEYGTKTPPQQLFQDMTEIFSVSDWGFYES